MTFREKIKNNPIIVFLYKISIKILSLCTHPLPLQRKIVFNSFHGRGFCDDPKYIYLEFEKKKLPIKYIWLVNDLNVDMPHQIKKVKINSWLAYYHYLTAKIWIDNEKSNIKPPKRKGQFYLQTWHGSFGIKKVEQAIEDRLSQDYVKAAKKDSSKTDLMYSNHQFQINLFKTSFWYNGKVIHSGLPRLSIILHPNNQVKEKIYKEFNIPKNKKILLYAPTFRKNNSLVPYLWDYHLILSEMRKKFKEDFVLLIRLHPNISLNKIPYSFNKDIIDATQYPDMDELMSIAQIMITDFSGTLIDMAIVHKPVFIFAKDFFEYINNDRGQSFPPEELPFSIATTEQEFIVNIRKFDFCNYKQHVNSFFQKIGLQEDGNGAKTIFNILNDHLT